MKLSNLFILFLILLPIFTFFSTRGMVTHDEGYILNSAQKILEGQLPYRDFHFVYTPLSIFATAFSFLIFSPSILASRILMIIINLLTSLLIYKTVMLATKNKLYATLAVLIFAAWGPSHINFSWPVMYAIFTLFLCIYLLLKFNGTRNNLYLFGAGMSVFLVFLAKQNFGMAIPISVIIFFAIKHARSAKYILPFTYGYIWGIIIFGLYLLSTKSFAPFLNDFNDFTIKRILINDRLSTSFIYPDSPVLMILRTFVYLLPAILSLTAFILLFIRRRFHLLFIPVSIFIFYIVGIRTTTDYVHLAPLLSLTGIPIALYLRYNISSTARIILLFLSVGIIFTGFHTALFKGYYRWDSPLIKHSIFSNNPKVNIFLNSKSSQEFSDLEKIANTYTREGDYIFVNSYNPMIYFITGRRESTKNNFLTTEINQNKYYEEVLGNLIAKEIKIILLDHKSLESSPIKKYIKDNYRFNKRIEEFDIYVRNP